MQTILGFLFMSFLCHFVRKWLNPEPQDTSANERTPMRLSLGRPFLQVERTRIPARTLGQEAGSASGIWFRRLMHRVRDAGNRMPPFYELRKRLLN